MTFENLEQIKKYYGIQEVNIAKIRTHLKDRLKPLHPDTNDGSDTFSSEKNEKDYNEVLSALEFLKTIESKSLAITTFEIKELVKATISELVPTLEGANLEKVDLLEDLKVQQDQSVTNFKIKHRGLKITSTSLTLLLTSIWMFPQIIDGHKILSNIFKNPLILSLLWLSALSIIALTWTIIKRREKLKDDTVSSFSLESIQNNMFTLFVGFCSGKFDFWYDDHSVLKFSKDDFTAFLMNDYFDLKYLMDHKLQSEYTYEIFKKYDNKKRTGWTPLHLLRPRLRYMELDLAVSLNELLFERFLEKKVISKLDKVSLTELYLYKTQ